MKEWKEVRAEVGWSLSERRRAASGGMNERKDHHIVILWWTRRFIRPATNLCSLRPHLIMGVDTENEENEVNTTRADGDLSSS